MNTEQQITIELTDEKRMDIKPQNTGGGWLSWIGIVMLMVIVCVSITGIYHLFLGKKDVQFGTVDIVHIVSIREKEFAELLNKENVSDSDRENAFELVKRIGPEIDKALVEVQRTCQCVLLVKGAVASRNVVDYTPHIKTLLGMK